LYIFFAIASLFFLKSFVQYFNLSFVLKIPPASNKALAKAADSYCINQVVCKPPSPMPSR